MNVDNYYLVNYLNNDPQAEFLQAKQMFITALCLPHGYFTSGGIIMG